jgi:hypothetical protein
MYLPKLQLCKPDPTRFQKDPSARLVKRLLQHEPKLNYPRLQGEGFEITGRLEVDLTHSLLLSVIPAQAGIQFSSSASWIPVFTGMTILMLYCSYAHGAGVIRTCFGMG